MPNIRIKDIPTTASATSSTDFIGIDGSANGTRKLNAFSPTFGGNLTVSGGTGTFSGSSPTLSTDGLDRAFTFTSPGAGGTMSFLAGGVNWLGASAQAYVGVFIGGNTSINQLTISQSNSLATLGSALGFKVTNTTASTSTTTGALVVTGGVGVGGAINAGGNIKAKTIQAQIATGATSAANVEANSALITQAAGGTLGLYFSHDTTANRPLIQSVTGGTAFSMLLNPYGGNLLIGTTTDSSNGKLQLATHTTSAGGIGFGTDTQLYRSSANAVTLGSGGNSQFNWLSGSSERALAQWTSGVFELGSVGSASVRFITNNTTALTLDSSQNATFAGFATVSKKTTTATQSSFVLGDDLAITTNSGRSKMTLGSTNSVSEILLGQTSSNCLVLQWEYAANVANARGLIGTYGYSNPIAILASSVTIGTGPSATTALTLTSAQQVQANATTDSTSTTTGALTVAGGVGIAKKLYASGVYAKPTSGWATLEAQAPAADTSAAIDFVPSGTLSSSNPVWFAGHRYSAHGPLSFWVYNGTSHENTVFSLANTGNLTIGGSLTTAAPTSGTAKAWKLGEVATVSPTSPNRTIRVEIDGTVYYISAKTTND